MRSGYTMGVERAVMWHRIESDLFRFVEDLRQLYDLPRSASIISSAVTCSGYYKEMRTFRRELRRTRGWFSLHQALLSYEIAVAESMDGEEPNLDDIPRWFQKLTGQWSQYILSGIRTSAASFNAYNPRVGAFIDIRNPPIGQFAVPWCMKFHVPVWYYWGRDEAIRDHMKCLTPPAEHLQRATTFLIKTPSASQPSVVPSEKPWMAFLEKRQHVCEGLAANETENQRQMRCQRERQRPSVKTAVFVWEEDENGLYKRNCVPPRENKETLDQYGENQKVYNAFLNEWDCGVAFGDLTPQEKMAMDYDSDGSDDESLLPASDWPRATTPSPALSAEPQLHLTSVNNQSSSVAVALEQLASTTQDQAAPMGPWIPRFQAPERAYVYDVGSYPATQMLYEFYGFTPPLPVPIKHQSPIPISDGVVKIFRAIVGMYSIDPGFEKSVIFQYCLEFLTSYAVNVSRNELFDLSEGNRQPLAGCKRIKFLCRHANLFIFDISLAEVPWQLAVTNPIDALFVCRLPPNLGPQEIARELYNRGVQFHTLLPCCSSPSIIPPLPMPIRTSDYQFTKTDYLAYVQEREALLRKPRVARAALMQGGIVWRLVVSLVSFWDILRGPTSSVTLHGQGLLLLVQDAQLSDDDLDPSELDKLCGVVYCYTGKYIMWYLNY